MNEVYGQRKVQYELRTGDEQKYEDNAVIESVNVCVPSGYMYEAHQVRLFNTQTSPNVQPTVVSPRRLRQLNNKSTLTSLPATRAVNIMRIAAQA